MKLLDYEMECRIRENSDVDVDEMETVQALRKENNRKRKVEEMDSEKEPDNISLNNSDDIEVSSDFEQMDLLSDDEDVDNQGNKVTILCIVAGLAFDPCTDPDFFLFFLRGWGKEMILFAAEVQRFDPPWSAHDICTDQGCFN